jgi:succinate dehydrogenase / fumarate reductase cytochrome b subunit
MNWFTRTLSSSVGKKLLMALTGLGFIGFLVGHLIGNLTIYGGPDLFNAYAHHLHAMGPLVTVAEVVLLLFAIIHVTTGLILFYQNYKARPVKYKMDKTGGSGRTIGSTTMPYTGILLLAFIVFHLINFHFVDKTEITIAEIVANAFSNPLYVLTYVVAMVIVALHVSHGFWSAFQTLGLNHPKYMPTIWMLTIVLAIIFGIGFGFLPVYVSFIA